MYERFKRALFIRIKHNMPILGVVPFKKNYVFGACFRMLAVIVVSDFCHFHSHVCLSVHMLCVCVRVCVCVCVSVRVCMRLCLFIVKCPGISPCMVGGCCRNRLYCCYSSSSRVSVCNSFVCGYISVYEESVSIGKIA